jgi:hypothetical protein
MAFSTSTVQPSAPQSTSNLNSDLSPLFGMIVLSVYAGNKSKKEFRKLKRRFMWTSFKLKLKSMFSKKEISDRTLLYILIGVLFLVLLVINFWLALVVALVALILFLTDTI